MKKYDTNLPRPGRPTQPTVQARWALIWESLKAPWWLWRSCRDPDRLSRTTISPAPYRSVFCYKSYTKQSWKTRKKRLQKTWNWSRGSTSSRTTMERFRSKHVMDQSRSSWKSVAGLWKLLLVSLQPVWLSCSCFTKKNGKSVQSLDVQRQSSTNCRWFHKVLTWVNTFQVFICTKFRKPFLSLHVTLCWFITWNRSKTLGNVLWCGQSEDAVLLLSRRKSSCCRLTAPVELQLHRDTCFMTADCGLREARSFCSRRETQLVPPVGLLYRSCLRQVVMVLIIKMSVIWILFRWAMGERF